MPKGSKIQELFTRASSKARGIFGSKTAKNLTKKQFYKAKEIPRIPRPAQLAKAPTVMNARDKRLFTLGATLALAGAVLLGMQLYNLNRDIVPLVGGSYTEGLIGAPQLINPLYASTSDVDSDLTRLVYSGLMTYSGSEGLVTDLADSYTISEDGLEYTFNLRDDALWHDGERLRADDVIFTYSAIQNAEYRSPLQNSFEDVQIEQVDELTVKFTLSEPFAPFLTLLTTGILPAHIWQSVAPINAAVVDLNRKPIGSGPYKFSKLTRDGRGNIHSIEIERFDRYYGDGPYIRDLSFRFYPDNVAAADALLNRNVEGVSFVSNDNIGRLKRDNSVQLVQPALQQYTAVFFNLDSDGVIASDNLRDALNLAVDKNDLTERALGYTGTPTNSFLLSSMQEEIQPFEAMTDIDAANALLDEAGYERNEEDGIRRDGEDPIIVNLTVLDSPELLAVAEILQESWKQLGIEVGVTPVSFTEFQTTVLPERDYDMLLAGVSYATDPDPYTFWHSSQSEGTGLNLSGLVDRDVDALIIEAREEIDEAERKAIYAELEELVLAETPAVFLYQPLYTYATAKNIKGIDLNLITNPADRLSDIHEWYIKTRRVLK
jgi:peptide/nickel transport system substrate-binding protein